MSELKTVTHPDGLVEGGTYLVTIENEDGINDLKLMFTGSNGAFELSWSYINRIRYIR